MIEIIEGNLLDQDGYICHQCNSTSSYAKGLALAIFNKFPKANIYINNIPKNPGEIIILENVSETAQSVINMIAQITPGKPYKTGDYYSNRIVFFVNCLKKISEYFEKRKAKLYFPNRIGCGLAGGNWNTYKLILEQFSYENKNLQIFIVKFD